MHLKHPDSKQRRVLSGVSTWVPLWLLGVCIPRGKKLLDIAINLELQVSAWRREYGLRSLAGNARAERAIYFARVVQYGKKSTRLK